jgi:hypothetical protein
MAEAKIIGTDDSTNVPQIMRDTTNLSLCKDLIIRFVSPLSGKEISTIIIKPRQGYLVNWILTAHYITILADIYNRINKKTMHYFAPKSDTFIIDSEIIPIKIKWCNAEYHRWVFMASGTTTLIDAHDDLMSLIKIDEQGNPCITIDAIVH